MPILENTIAENISVIGPSLEIADDLTAVLERPMPEISLALLASRKRRLPANMAPNSAESPNNLVREADEMHSVRMTSKNKFDFGRWTKMSMIDGSTL
jgi:hypothetical protein